MSTRPREEADPRRRAPATGVPEGGRVYTGAVVHVDRSHLACVPAAAATETRAPPSQTPDQFASDRRRIPPQNRPGRDEDKTAMLPVAPSWIPSLFSGGGGAPVPGPKDTMPPMFENPQQKIERERAWQQVAKRLREDLKANYESSRLQILEEFESSRLRIQEDYKTKLQIRKEQGLEQDPKLEQDLAKELKELEEELYKKLEQLELELNKLDADVDPRDVVPPLSTKRIRMEYMGGHYTGLTVGGVPHGKGHLSRAVEIMPLKHFPVYKGAVVQRIRLILKENGCQRTTCDSDEWNTAWENELAQVDQLVTKVPTPPLDIRQKMKATLSELQTDYSAGDTTGASGILSTAALEAFSRIRHFWPAFFHVTDEQVSGGEVQEVREDILVYAIRNAGGIQEFFDNKNRQLSRFWMELLDDKWKPDPPPIVWESFDGEWFNGKWTGIGAFEREKRIPKQDGEPISYAKRFANRIDAKLRLESVDGKTASLTVHQHPNPYGGGWNEQLLVPNARIETEDETSYMVIDDKSNMELRVWSEHEWSRVSTLAKGGQLQWPLNDPAGIRATGRIQRVTKSGDEENMEYVWIGGPLGITGWWSEWIMLSGVAVFLAAAYSTSDTTEAAREKARRAKEVRTEEAATKHTNTTLRSAVKDWLAGGERRKAAEAKWGESITHWNTRNVTDMNELFMYAWDFNQPLEWDTRNVTDVSRMFYGAEAFDQHLAWDTRNVTDMNRMFYGATSFDQHLAWDTRNVTDMGFMFRDARAFNNGGQPLAWDTRSATYTVGMFTDATSFDQHLAWDTRNMRNTTGMFDQSKGGRLDSSRAAIAATLATSDARRAVWDAVYRAERAAA